MEKFRESVTANLAKAGNAIGLETKASEDSSSSSASEAMDELSSFCPKLTYKQRLIGFATCYGVGYLITFSSFHFFIELIEGNPMPFVISYTAGNFLSLGASTFLSGPQRQIKSMMDDKRKITSIVYISSLVLTVITCFINMNHKAKLFLLVTLVIVQFCAMIWYNLSYIPFGRRTAKKMIRDYTGLEEIV
jgi:hypothetical protein